MPYIPAFVSMRNRICRDEFGFGYVYRIYRICEDGDYVHYYLFPRLLRKLGTWHQ